MPKAICAGTSSNWELKYDIFVFFFVSRLYRLAVDVTVVFAADVDSFSSSIFVLLCFLQVNSEGDVEIDEPRDLFTQENFKNFECDWADKQETAFFRWGYPSSLLPPPYMDSYSTRLEVLSPAVRRSSAPLRWTKNHVQIASYLMNTLPS